MAILNTNQLINPHSAAIIARFHEGRQSITDSCAAGFCLLNATTSPFSPAYAVALKLDALPLIPDEDPGVETIRACWAKFREAAHQNETELTTSAYDQLTERLSPYLDRPQNTFSDTDLIVVPNNFAGNRENNIVETQLFQIINEFYHLLSHTPTLLNISGPESFRENVLQNLRKILTRSCGQKLITEIVKHAISSSTIVIKPGCDDLTHGPSISNSGITEYPIELNDQRQLFVPVETSGKKILQLLSKQIILAHELIHLLHLFENTLLVAQLQIYSDPDFTNLEEQRTITGTTNLAGFAHEMSENRFREQFHLSRRISHLVICESDMTPHLVVECSLNEGLNGTVALELGKSKSLRCSFFAKALREKNTRWILTILDIVKGDIKKCIDDSFSIDDMRIALHHSTETNNFQLFNQLFDALYSLPNFKQQYATQNSSSSSSSSSSLTSISSPPPHGTKRVRETEADTLQASNKHQKTGEFDEKEDD